MAWLTKKRDDEQNVEDPRDEVQLVEQKDAETEAVDAETDFSDDSPLGKRSTFYVLRKTVREFSDDSGTDMAAGLTYYSVLSIFPAALALLSLLGVIGQGQSALNKALEVLAPLVSASTLDSITPTLRSLANSDAASLTLILGVVGALWSASGYVGAFGRSLNRIYEVSEGRPIWKLRPTQVLITLVTVLLIGVALLMLVVSGPVAKSVGDTLGLGKQTVQVWDYAKWPVLALIVIAIVAMLYHFTPNVRMPKFRVLSVGAFVAILVWLLASAGFAFYVANFSSYNKTYGAVAGVVVAMLWLWLTNVALLFGAELDAELERARELHRGIAAEERIQLPMRDDRGVRKADARRVKDAEAGRLVRTSRTGAGNPGDRPF